MRGARSSGSSSWLLSQTIDRNNRDRRNHLMETKQVGVRRFLNLFRYGGGWIGVGSGLCAHCVSRDPWCIRHHLRLLAFPSKQTTTHVFGSRGNPQSVLGTVSNVQEPVISLVLFVDLGHKSTSLRRSAVAVHKQVDCLVGRDDCLLTRLGTRYQGATTPTIWIVLCRERFNDCGTARPDIGMEFSDVGMKETQKRKNT